MVKNWPAESGCATRTYPASMDASVQRNVRMYPLPDRRTSRSCLVRLYLIAESRLPARSESSGFHGMVTAHPDAPVDTTALGKLAALSGVRRFPGRVKCATMAWHTLQSAIGGTAR